MCVANYHRNGNKKNKKKLSTFSRSHPCLFRYRRSVSPVNAIGAFIVIRILYYLLYMIPWIATPLIYFCCAKSTTTTTTNSKTAFSAKTKRNSQKYEIKLNYSDNAWNRAPCSSLRSKLGLRRQRDEMGRWKKKPLRLTRDSERESERPVGLACMSACAILSK